MNSNKLLLLVAILFTANAALTRILQISPSAEFCWRDSYGRGVGTIPSDCGSREKIGLLCYDKCPAGYSRYGFDCHQNCLAGWRDDGLFCRLAEYGRGAGYPYWASDWFQSWPRVQRCEADHGVGNCEWWGAIVYPKCRAGFSPFGCCICRPNVPNCIGLGFNGGIDLSCAKKIIIGTPYSASCPVDRENNAGLCYQKCKTGYNGVGPVCWAKAPSIWVECGMGAAKTSTICADIIFDQISSVGQMALKIASMVLTAGGSAAATSGTTAAANAAKISELKSQLDAIKKILSTAEKAKNLVIKA